ncbi:pyruvate synthase [bacterium 1XD8-76]|nr:pyruvate synthase [bacterium 1XD8-76]
MKNTVEIRWHGRGGQGAKTAALLLADVAFKTGKYVQGFPEYGPERMGAPITAYNRISRDPITIHSNIYSPDYVVVVDDGLLAGINVAQGLKKEGAVIVNTERSREEIASQLRRHGWKGSVYTVDARKISLEALGRYYPNSPMLAAAVAVSGVVTPAEFLKEMEDSFAHKFAKKPEVIEGNMKALEMTFEALAEDGKRPVRKSA